MSKNCNIFILKMKHRPFIMQALFFICLLLSSCTTAKIQDHNYGDFYTNNESQYYGEISDPNSIAYFNKQIGNKVYFDINEDILSENSRQILFEQAGWIKNHPYYKIIIEGHGDDRGTREYNIALGERRAFEVKKYLIANGIDSKKISTISYGKENPEVFGHTESAWQLNRRAVTLVK